MKTCTKCETEKDEHQFRNRGNGLHSWCRECEKEANKARYIPRPKRERVVRSDKEISLGAKKRMLKHRYGITIEEYEAMYEIQNGVCAICENEFKLGGHKGLYVDHDHSTGEVRGLLCSSCNSAIGKLRESKIIIENAIKYLNL